MKISELPEEVRVKAFKYFSKGTDDLGDAFDWDKTEEGADYWYEWNIAELQVKETIIDKIVNCITVKEEPKHYNKKGIKESAGKLSYELDFNFIESMSLRMAKNKGKYEPYNWQRPIDIDELKQSLFRHVMEVMKGNYQDEGDALGHLEAIAINAMIINYQLKNK